VRIDKKENRLHAINKIQATPVNSSIIDAPLNFDILREVNTIRQNPIKLEDVFRICGDLLSAIGLNNLVVQQVEQVKSEIIFYLIRITFPEKVLGLSWF
jgi:hypothetical protein